MIFLLWFVNCCRRILRTLFVSVDNCRRMRNISFENSRERPGERRISSLKFPPTISFPRSTGTRRIFLIPRSLPFLPLPITSKRISAPKIGALLQRNKCAASVAVPHCNVPIELNRERDFALLSPSAMFSLQRFHARGDLQASSLQSSAEAVESMSTMFSLEIQQGDLALRSEWTRLRRDSQGNPTQTRSDRSARRSAGSAELHQPLLGQSRRTNREKRSFGIESDLRSGKQSRSPAERSVARRDPGRAIGISWVDSEASLANVRHSLEVECEKRGLGKHLVQYYGLISARTGYGVEDFISKVYRYWSQHGSSLAPSPETRSIVLLCLQVEFIFSVGPMPERAVYSIFFSIPICVTFTPSIVFNERRCPISLVSCSLLLLFISDSLSPSPGTTMNVLRFPIQLRTGKNQFLRTERLKEAKLDDSVGQCDLSLVQGQDASLVPEPTVKWRRRFESEVNLPKSGVAYSYSSGENSFQEDRSFRSREENYIHYRQKKMRAFQAQSYEREKWLYDTPGVTLAEQVDWLLSTRSDTRPVSSSSQMINRCSSEEELSFFDHQTTVIEPMNISLTSGETIFVGGIVRIDVKQVEGSSLLPLLGKDRRFRSPTTLGLVSPWWPPPVCRSTSFQR